MAKTLYQWFQEALARTTAIQEASDNMLPVAAPLKRLSFSSPDDAAIQSALESISATLGNSYVQVLSDIASEDRVSWAGTAHEIREILRVILETLAPDSEVIQQSWYKLESNAKGPTQKQRVRLILDKHSAGSKEREVVETVEIFSEAVGSLIRASYSRASDAAHRSKNRREVEQILRYFRAFVHDLLNI